MFQSRKLINPRSYQPSLPVPKGYSKAGILDSLVSVSISGSATGELRDYATADCERFLHTLDLVPQDAEGRMLEIGANPYFTTLLMRRFRPALALDLVNFFGPEAVDRAQEVVFRNFEGVEERTTFDFLNLNIEADALPYPDDHFDHIIFCEVLEHLTIDPLRAVMELKRVLKPDGCMVLTTPNAVRLENVIAFIEGRNIYDPYSAYGPHGRHNREYTRHELHQLMEHAGFRIEVSYTGNVHDDIGSAQASARIVNAAIQAQKSREHDLGQYLFTRWRNTPAGNAKLPRWLYRSYSEDRMA
ncbi:class I SAM-dependent methyltransferase [Pseudoxanthomonas gei]|uniref:Class I SAM-dependent methyltransferase n=1 Tax=Pseudoxanthomonas gei TaxID=1383030 RepID=A0ABX0AA01_9GAMM|nr:class I SAM-dependent methyltransferase [Pseudoxanthomonas gei]NDK38357.1 class I SAM-dependent methyltransferase [Pseudoxanthomonas gei]